MFVVRVDDEFFGGRDLVERRELRGWWADCVHQTGSHQDLSLDAGAQVLHVDVAKCAEESFDLLVIRIESAQVLAYLARYLQSSGIFFSQG